MPRARSPLASEGRDGPTETPIAFELPPHLLAALVETVAERAAKIVLVREEPKAEEERA